MAYLGKHWVVIGLRLFRQKLNVKQKIAFVLWLRKVQNYAIISRVLLYFSFRGISFSSSKFPTRALSLDPAEGIYVTSDRRMTNPFPSLNITTFTAFAI